MVILILSCCTPNQAYPDVQLPDLIITIEINSIFEEEIEGDAWTIYKYDYIISNVGNASANLDGPTDVDHDNVSIQDFFSSDMVFDWGDTPGGGGIIDLSPIGSIAPGEVYNGRESAAIKTSDIPSKPYLITIVDWGDSVIESDENNNYLVTDVSVFRIDPVIAQWPMSGPAGTHFTQWGTGFTPNTIATLHFQMPDGTEYPTKDISIEQDGHFVEPYDAPLYKPIGDYTWWAVDTTGVKSNEVTYTITDRAVPTIAQWPMKGTPGTTFTQWGTGFTPNTIGTFHIKKPDSTEYEPFPIVISPDGSFEVTYTAQLDKAFGTYQWWGVDGATNVACTPISYVIEAGEKGVLAGFILRQNGGQILDQEVNTPFRIEVTAIDGVGDNMSGYNGDIYISTETGRVDPFRLEMVAGTVSEEIILYDQGLTTLKCESGGKLGYSNSFLVQGTGSCNATLTGKVVDFGGAPVWKAIVTIYNYESQEIQGSYWTNEAGEYSIPNLSCGKYKLRIEKQDALEERFNISIRSSLTYSEGITRLQLNRFTEGTPVILIPGIMGSSIGVVSPYPKLPRSKPAKNLHIHAPRRLGWADLRELLEDGGFNVIECPWDWRLDCEKAYEYYLIPKIKEALLTKSTTGKVHVIAHSMGGLVTRAYIQSGDNYGGEIDKFAMVGTPNLGSSNAYYIWEGGDPKGLDDMLDKGILSSLNVYSNTIQNIYEETYGLKGWRNYKHRTIRAFVRDVAPSLLQLMNVTSFLTDGESSWGVKGRGNDGKMNKNKWLIDLNSDPSIDDLMSWNGGYGTVRVKLYTGQSSKTISKIKTAKQSSPWFSNDLYEDGKPIFPLRKSAIWGDGDGTVPLYSAAWPSRDGWADLSYISSYKEHAKLMSDSAIQNALVSFLKHDLSQEYKRTLKVKPRVEEHYVNMSITTNGEVRLFLTDPDGRHMGIDPNTKISIQEITEGELIFTSNGGGLQIDNPLNGVYNLTYFSESEEDFILEIGLIDNDSYFTKKLRGISAETPRFLSFTYSGAAETFLTINHLVNPPSTLKAMPYSTSGTNGPYTATRLTWQKPSSSDISGFNVYSANENELFFQKVAHVSAIESFLETGDQWAQDFSVDVIFYAVSAVDNDGNESFFSNIVRNNDQDDDNLSDADEIALGTQIDQPDTDGDEIIDGDEGYYGTNPLAMDTDGDTIIDYIEIQADTDPLDPESFPLKGDINGDNVVNLEDVILSLQILTEISHEQFTNKTNEVNGDLRIGLEEAFYGLKEVAID